MLLRLLAFTSSAQPAPAPALVRVARIWDTGAHDAFTDLIRWRDRWYCAFREADAHVGGDGRIRVLVSADGEAWTSAALIGEERIDLRDPKLSLTPDGRLMIVAGAETFPIPTVKGNHARFVHARAATLGMSRVFSQREANG